MELIQAVARGQELYRRVFMYKSAQVLVRNKAEINEKIRCNLTYFNEMTNGRLDRQFQTIMYY